MLYTAKSVYSMIEQSKDVSSKPQKFMVSVTGEMYSKLLKERDKLMLSDVQDVVRLAISQYFVRPLTQGIH